MNGKREKRKDINDRREVESKEGGNRRNKKRKIKEIQASRRIRRENGKINIDRTD